MSAPDYLAAVSAAQQQGIALSTDEQGCGPTPWDLTLRPTYNATRHKINEESLTDAILSAE